MQSEHKKLANQLIRRFSILHAIEMCELLGNGYLVGPHLIAAVKAHEEFIQNIEETGVETVGGGSLLSESLMNAEKLQMRLLLQLRCDPFPDIAGRGMKEYATSLFGDEVRKIGTEIETTIQEICSLFQPDQEQKTYPVKQLKKWKRFLLNKGAHMVVNKTDEGPRLVISTWEKVLSDWKDRLQEHNRQFHNNFINSLTSLTLNLPFLPSYRGYQLQPLKWTYPSSPFPSFQNYLIDISVQSISSHLAFSVREVVNLYQLIGQNEFFRRSFLYFSAQLSKAVLEVKPAKDTRRAVKKDDDNDDGNNDDRSSLSEVTTFSLFDQAPLTRLLEQVLPANDPNWIYYKVLFFYMEWTLHGKGTEKERLELFQMLLASSQSNRWKDQLTLWKKLITNQPTCCQHLSEALECLEAINEQIHRGDQIQQDSVLRFLILILPVNNKSQLIQLFQSLAKAKNYKLNQEIVIEIIQLSNTHQFDQFDLVRNFLARMDNLISHEEDEYRNLRNELTLILMELTIAHHNVDSKIQFLNEFVPFNKPCLAPYRLKPALENLCKNTQIESLKATAEGIQKALADRQIDLSFDPTTWLFILSYPPCPPYEFYEDDILTLEKLCRRYPSLNIAHCVLLIFQIQNIKQENSGLQEGFLSVQRRYEFIKQVEMLINHSLPGEIFFSLIFFPGLHDKALFHLNKLKELQEKLRDKETNTQDQAERFLHVNLANEIVETMAAFELEGMPVKLLKCSQTLKAELIEVKWKLQNLISWSILPIPEPGEPTIHYFPTELPWKVVPGKDNRFPPCMLHPLAGTMEGPTSLYFWNTTVEGYPELTYVMLSQLPIPTTRSFKATLRVDQKRWNSNPEFTQILHKMLHIMGHERPLDKIDDEDKSKQALLLLEHTDGTLPRQFQNSLDELEFFCHYFQEFDKVKKPFENDELLSLGFKFLKELKVGLRKIACGAPAPNREDAHTQAAYGNLYPTYKDDLTLPSQRLFNGFSLLPPGGLNHWNSNYIISRDDFLDELLEFCLSVRTLLASSQKSLHLEHQILVPQNKASLTLLIDTELTKFYTTHKTDDDEDIQVLTGYTAIMKVRQEEYQSLRISVSYPKELTDLMIQNLFLWQLALLKSLFYAHILK